MKWLITLRLLALGAKAQQFDLIITQGIIIDGTGNSYYFGNIGIQEERSVPSCT